MYSQVNQSAAGTGPGAPAAMFGTGVEVRLCHACGCVGACGYEAARVAVVLCVLKTLTGNGVLPHLQLSEGTHIVGHAPDGKAPEGGESHEGNSRVEPERPEVDLDYFCIGNKKRKREINRGEGEI